MSDHVLRIADLHVEFKVFEGQLKVLNGVNMDVGPGARVGLVGEAGCGKTTMMRCVLGILQSPPGRISDGTILFHDEDVLKMSQANLQQIRGGGISMIFQDPVAALNPVFTVGDQLTSVIRYAATKKMDKKEIRRRAIKALADVQLPDPDRMFTSYPVQLSGGMRQRVWIAMALATEPELMIADEPTTALDVTIQAQVLRLLNALVEERSTSVIFITHSLGVVKEMADWVYVMYAGNIVEGAKKELLFEKPLHPYTRGLLGALPKLTGGGMAEGIPGRIPDYLNPPTGCRFNPRCPGAMQMCDGGRPELREVEPDHRVACYLYGGDDDVE
ncbi:ABC transporter ATP-binding protein [bacterium]|nr:ABC transporter ATP-binding protein [bacterium]